MIEIFISPSTIIVTGHANYDNNNDIVCAGVSAVVLGACQLWIKNSNIIIQQTIEPAQIKAKFTTAALNNQQLVAQRQLLIFQLKKIALHYPNYVQIKQIN
ncbi:Ribosomal-processing cysteine protease Prp family protein [[Mycoplasma] cavipharyngis]|uniref:ribosomal-processing cysteine protease Prp n=1 Tax=[Mycoplasma] cavipharyngis TaxID=92757 RepID=UPI0037040B5D